MNALSVQRYKKMLIEQCRKLKYLIISAKIDFAHGNLQR